MTSRELLAFPNDRIERYLINGELREKPHSYRPPANAIAHGAIAGELGAWAKTAPGSMAVVSRASIRVCTEPDTVVFADLALLTSAMAKGNPEETWFFDGPPILAVEILSPNDKQEHIDEKIESYLNAGTSVVWIVNAVRHTVTAYRPNREPEFFNRQDDLHAAAELPGFRVPMRELFA